MQFQISALKPDHCLTRADNLPGSCLFTRIVNHGSDAEGEHTGHKSQLDHNYNSRRSLSLIFISHLSSTALGLLYMLTGSTIQHFMCYATSLHEAGSLPPGQFTSASPVLLILHSRKLASSWQKKLARPRGSPEGTLSAHAGASW